MSLRANTWAIRAVMGRGLLPAQKLLLWHLADRHNPDYGCFPKVARLALDLERSRASVMVDLKKLEAVGLIRREARKCPETGRQMTTRYVLGFEDGFEAMSPGPDDGGGPTCGGRPEDDPCPEVGPGEEGPASADPGAVSGEVRVQNPAKVRVQCAGPITSKKRTSKKVCSPPAADEHTHTFDYFWQAHPRPRNRERTAELFAEAVEAGTDPATLIRAARSYAGEQAGNAPAYVCQSDNWLATGRWRDFPEAAVDPGAGLGEAGGELQEAAVARFWAEKLRAKRYVPPNAINATVADRMVGLGLVSPADLRRAGARA
ncbi:MAG TPA: helix-turn-helix domain-containing protein [Paracoccaceae bacterium]|nr:helix-turn-helix domain-containing protein [Paracoccaceae bacterium]